MRLFLVNMFFLERILLFLVGIGVLQADAKATDDPIKKAGGMLKALYYEQQGSVPAAADDDSMSKLMNWAKYLNVQEDGSVPVDIVASGEGADLEQLLVELDALGFQRKSTYRHMVSGKIPVSAMADMCNCENLVFARPVLPHLNAGSVLSEGVAAMEADVVQEAPFDLDGTGLTIGILSDSYDFLGGADDDIASGDLPSEENIIILKELSEGDGSDEGRAMMQLIHDVAPGAKLVFRTAFEGEADFAVGVEELVDAGCEIIVDDVLYLSEPWFQDGIIAQAIEKVRSMNVAYFSAAGNFGRTSYESKFVPSGITGEGFSPEQHNFNANLGLLAPDVRQLIYLQRRAVVSILLQWDEPSASASPESPGSTSDLDLFLIDPETGEVVSSRDDNIGGNPFEVLNVPVSAYMDVLGIPPEVDGRLFDIVIGLESGDAPRLFKLQIDNGEFIEYDTNSGTSVGHLVAAGGAGVGAAFYQNTPRYGVDPPKIQPDSSAGGTPILFDVDGNRLWKPDVRKQPRVTGPDGTSTTFFGEVSDLVPNPLFFGTSASAPHVAAVAALMLQQDPFLKPYDVFDILQETAIDMDDPGTPDIFDEGFDFGTGYGLVNATSAIEEVIARGKEKKSKRSSKKRSKSNSKRSSKKSGKGKGGMGSNFLHADGKWHANVKWGDGRRLGETLN